MKFTNISNGRSSWAEDYTNTTTGKVNTVWDLGNDELRRVSFSLGFLVFSNRDFNHIDEFKGFENRDDVEDYYEFCQCYMCKSKRKRI